MFSLVKNLVWVLVVALVFTCPLVAQPEQAQPVPDPAPLPDFGFLSIGFSDVGGIPGALAIFKPGSQSTMTINFGSQGSLGRGKLTIMFAEIMDTTDGPLLLTPGLWFEELVTAESPYVRNVLVPEYLAGRSFVMQASCSYENGVVEYSPIVGVTILSAPGPGEVDGEPLPSVPEDTLPGPSKKFLMVTDFAPTTEP